MKKIIKLTESDLHKIVTRVLNEQLANVVDSPEEIMNFQKELIKLGYNLGKNGPQKNGVDGKIGRLTRGAIAAFQRASKLPVTGKLDQMTQNKIDYADSVNYKASTAEWNQKLIQLAQRQRQKQSSEWGTEKQWDDYNKKRLSGDKTNLDKTKPKNNKNRCIAVSSEECDKISPNAQTVFSSGAETRCSAYMVKCLSQYDTELGSANAWQIFNTVKNKGSVKYNAFTDGSINWNYIYSQIKKNKFGKDFCNDYLSKGMDADKKIKSELPNIISNSVPQSPKIDINSLELGDIVGLYHSGSANKGMAFCERALGRNLDSNGNMDKDPFTFNSHVGFVGAIKNGIPIIIHNVHGKHTATPANKMLNKNSEDMIVWVVSDNEVKNAVSQRNPEKTIKKDSSSGNFWGAYFE
jgi:peptidoglycan hydrolase-like protein with peptidoglycan-binding domain